MKKLLLIISLFSTKVLFAQKDCKFTKSIDPQTGQQVEMITANTGLGKFTLGKTGDKKLIIYNTKIAFQLLSNPANLVSLKIDSVRFILTDYKQKTFTVSGQGYVGNNLVLKPQLESIMFFIMADANDVELLSKGIMAFKVYGEKDSEYADSLNDKQREKVNQAFQCIK